MRDKYFISAAGEGSRWNNYLDTPKHLLKINGETLLDRMVRQLRERGEEDITVVSQNYQIEHVTNINRTPNYTKHTGYGDLGAHLDWRKRWNTDGRTIFLLGDTYYTDDAMDKIVTNDRWDYTLFCRPYASEYTGKGWADIYASAWHSVNNDIYEQAMRYIAWLRGVSDLELSGDWELAAFLAGKVTSAEMNDRYDSLPAFEIIDDRTEDFDYPSDYDNWCGYGKM